MGLIRNWRRRRVLREHAVDSALWRRVAHSLPFLDGLDDADQRRLRELALLFLAEKQFAGARGFELTDQMRLSIALQACLPILNLGLDWYDGWVGIVVYAGDFRLKRSETDEAGVVHEWDDELAGESMPGGPVVLSWDATLASHDPDEDDLMNIVIHEFAHKLDMRNGAADGQPPLHSGMSRERWRAVFDAAYRHFCDAVDRGKETFIDPYAAEHPSEFFAVVSEVFFEWPHELKADYPEVYEQLALFYRQDPALRLPA